MTNFSGKNLNAACGGPQGGGMDSRRNGVAEVSPKYLADVTTNGVPDGYKQTEVGVIPEDWVIEKLGSIGKFKNGINKSADDFGFGYPFVNLMDVFGKPAIRGDESFGLINSTEIDKKEYSLVEGDVLFIRSSVKPSGVGLTTVVMSDLKETVYSGFLIRFRTDKQLVTEFKKHCFYEESLRVRVISGSTVSANTNINQDALKDIYFVFPRSKKEQTAIANALSDVDALIGELEKLIAKKQAIKTATMQQLLTGRTRLPQFALREDGTPKGIKPSELGEIPEDWECISIGRDTVLKARIGWQALTTKEYQTTGDIYLVTGTDFDSGAVKWERCFYVSEWRYKQDQNIQLRNNDVLITKDGTIGKVGYVTALSRPATLNSGVFVVRPKNNNLMQRFLFYVLTSRVFDDFINRITAGSTITHLYQKDFVNFEFSAPCIEEQTAIATILSDMDAEIQALEQRLGKTRQIKQGMMQELLTGKTRLIKGEAHG